MKNGWVGIGIFALVLAFVAGPACASLDLTGATNITVNDGIPDSLNPSLGWAGIVGTDAAGEDQEVENQSQTGQVWDFEAFLWDNSTDTLYLVAGYDFMTGLGTGPYGGAPLDGVYSAGDVFVHAAGVDYVIDFDRIVDTGNAAYNLDIDQNGVGTFVVREGYTSTVGAVLPANSAADPYAYLAGASSTDDNNGAGYTYQYYAGITDADLAAFGLVGGNHYVLEIDMSPITNLLAGGFTLEWTQECGNDKGTAAVPEPTTIAMAGAGLFGIVMGRRRMKKYVG